MKTYVIYHKNCYDGFCAAWIAKKALPADTIFIPANYGDTVPDIAPGSEIYILDFSYPKPVLQSLHFESKKLVVLDHHKTAQANLEGLDYCIFDMDRSGAGMTWDYFFPNEPRPRLVNYVEDRDLWRFKLGGTREVFEWVASFPMDFDKWDELSAELTKDDWYVLMEGGAILRYVNQKIEIACKEAMMVEIAGYTVPVVNVPYSMGSDCCERLLELYPEAPFSAYYLMRGDGEQQWGLRGRSSDDFDVSEIAKQFGGGGHKKASGFVKGRTTR